MTKGVIITVAVIGVIVLIFSFWVLYRIVDDNDEEIEELRERKKEMPESDDRYL